MPADTPAPSAPPCPASTAHAIMPGCPLGCLSPLLSARTFEPLRRGYGVLSGPPATVGDVITLCRQRRLTDIRGLGPRRAGQIEAALILAGLDIAGHHHH